MPERPYTITIADDEMEAWICFRTDTPLPLQRLYQDTAAAGVVCGIDQFLLQDLAEAHHIAQPYRIAQGTPPEEGLEYFFTRICDHTPKRLPDGRVDFYNLDTIQNVVQHQILVAQILPDASKPGKTVTGKDIQPTGESMPLPEAGANVEVAEDGKALIAQINGHPVLTGNVLRVDAAYILTGDVDFSVGNVTCIGDLVITGDVRSGFSVKGAREVSTHGVVDGGSIDAHGAVYLYGNVFGKHKSHIRSAQHVKGTYVDAATIEARKDIVLTRGARHSRLRAGESILMQGENSHIIGGTAQAVARILSQDLGSESEIDTRVEILPGVFDEATHSWFLHNIAAMLEEDSALLADSLDLGESPEPIDAMRETVQQCRAAVRCLSAYLKTRQQRLATMPLLIGTIVALGTVYPGVTIDIAGASLAVTKPLTGVMFYKAEGSIRVKALDGARLELPQAE